MVWCQRIRRSPGSSSLFPLTSTMAWPRSTKPGQQPGPEYRHTPPNYDADAQDPLIIYSQAGLVASHSVKENAQPALKEGFGI